MCEDKKKLKYNGYGKTVTECKEKRKDMLEIFTKDHAFFRDMLTTFKDKVLRNENNFDNSDLVD